MEREAKKEKEVARQWRLQLQEEQKRHSWAGGEEVRRRANQPAAHRDRVTPSDTM